MVIECLLLFCDINFPIGGLKPNIMKRVVYFISLSLWPGDIKHTNFIIHCMEWKFIWDSFITWSYTKSANIYMKLTFLQIRDRWQLDLIMLLSCYENKFAWCSVIWMQIRAHFTVEIIYTNEKMSWCSNKSRFTVCFICCMLVNT